MNKELELKLVKKYPNIFRDYGGDMRASCMHWGFGCGDGWYKIIDNLCQDIDALIGNKNIIVVADQVKEKFGGLRFYYHTDYTPSYFNKICNDIRNFAYNHKYGVGYNKICRFRKIFFRSTIEKISDAIINTESKSYITCEDCGDPGKTRGKAWVKTLCNECFKKEMK